ncbi:MAG TPA: exo-alpha-sialidase [Verrucomicrobiae bacterium]|jgi:photosystem II stability/assembly factor-like uncharacterized protein|nr:exo-alpha-sialidase [Verrucomicrobiae bacterium]
MSAKICLIVGTKKGLFLLTSADRRQWEWSGPFARGREVNHAVFDPRTRRIYATSNDAWFGCETIWSPDLGKTWENAQRNPSFPESSGTKLDRLWHIEPGRASEPGVLYMGVAPAALFRTTDGGANWDEMTALSQHPTRARWHPGAGGLCLHSIVIDHTNPQRLFVGISAVGVFRTEDGGQTWETANRGTRAEFMPDKYPEYGQCVHKLLLACDGQTLFQQNHCGMYRSGDGGRHWDEITPGLPSDFGFPLALHPRDPKTLFVLPLQGAEFRTPPEQKLRVFRSRDTGQSWQALGKGLPQENVFAGVYREGMASDSLEPAGVYFGTNTGHLYGSSDEGESWSLVANTLPPIYSVSVAVF